MSVTSGSASLRSVKIIFCIAVYFLGNSCNDENNALDIGNGKPFIVIISPQNNVEALDSIDVEIMASDDDGIRKVEFISNGQVIKVWDSPPYKFKWDYGYEFENAVQVIQAKAIDNNGNVSTTDKLKIIFSKLLTPDSLTFVSTSYNSITLKWKDRSKLETGYLIEKAVDEGAFFEETITSPNSDEYVVINLDSTRTYNFRITPIKGSYLGNPSEEIKIGFEAYYEKFKSINQEYANILFLNIIWDKHFFFGGHTHNYIKYWNTIDGSLIKSIPAGNGEVYINLIPGEDNFFTYTLSGDIKVRTIDNADIVNEFFTQKNLMSASISTDKKKLWTAHYKGNSNIIKVWDFKTGSYIDSLEFGEPTIVFGIFFNNSGSVAVVCTHGGKLIYINSADFSIIKTITAHSNYVYSYSVNLDNRFLASCENSGTIRLWDFDTGILLKEFDEERKVKLYFTPNNEYLVGAGENNLIRFWKINTAADIPYIIVNSHVSSVAISPKREMIVNSYPGGIYLWKINGKWKLLNEVYN